MTTALDEGRVAYAERRWCDVFDQLSAADQETPLGASDLMLLATSAILLGRNAQAADLQTRAHESFLASGDLTAAGRVAAWIAILLGNNGEHSRSAGWLARATRLAAEAPAPNVIGGLTLVPQALGALYGGDAARALTLFEQVTFTGEHVGDREVIELGRLGQGQSMVVLGRIDEGMALLDEVMVAVTANELGPLPAGIAYCSMIGTCWLALDVLRAQEWTAALDHWCHDQPDMVAFSGQCQTHRAALFVLRARWDDAIAAAQRAAERARLGDVPATFGANYQRAEAERMRGNLTEADFCFAKALETGWDPQPGLAMLRLAQGDVSAARTMITRALDHAGDGDRLNFLPALVEIEVCGGDASAARVALDELLDASSETSMPLARARTAYCEALVLLLEDDPASSHLAARASLSLWNRLTAPFEAARCRVVIGRACRELGEQASAQVEFTAARAAFTALGARVALAELNDVDPVETQRSGPLSPREVDVMRLVAAGKSNRDIAAELYLSEKTVARHLSNIFTKLDVASRTAAAAYAHEHQLLG